MNNMEKTMYEAMIKALEKAEEEHSKASYLSESGGNAGIRTMNTNKAEWLRWVVYLAQHGLKALEEEERLATERELVEEEDEELICEHCPVTAEAVKLTEVKDTLIKELTTKTEDLTTKFEALQLTYEYEQEQRGAFIERAKIDMAKDVSNFAHDRCWLDGADLVCSVELLDQHLIKLIKE
jgi:hypothetical protein